MVTESLTINERLKNAMKDNNISHRKLADGLGITRETTYQWCKSGRKISSHYIESLCNFIGVSINWLITGQEDESTIYTHVENQIITLLPGADKESKKALVVILKKIVKN